MSFTKNCDSSTVRGQKPPFSNTLRELKKHGCSVLLCGTVPEDVIDQMSARLLRNKMTSINQTYIFVTTNQDLQSMHTRLTSADVSIQSVRVISMEDVLRSPSAGNSTNSCQYEISTVSSDTNSLENALRHEIAELERDHGGFSPAQLRICVDVLPPLMVKEDNVSVEAFLDALDQMAAETKGMVHCILPLAHDAPLTERFIPYFDVTISLRLTEEGIAQQQWYLPVTNYRTNWFPVEFAPTCDTDLENQIDTD